MAESSWWRGHRGEWYVVVQMVLFALVAIGPRDWRGWPSWPFPSGLLVWLVGWALLLGGGVLAVSGVAGLGSRLNAVPYPAEGAVLRTTGVFCVVRHPMYCGAVFSALGWAALRQGWLTVGYALLLFVLFDLKSRPEECWLRARFPEYEEYQRKVRKLIPLVY